MSPGHSLLFVDDHPATLLGLRRLAAACRGIDTVKSAASSQDALALLSEHHFALACVDLGLPGELDGWALCERLRDSSPQIALVVFTGREEPGVLERAQAVGALGVVAKSDARKELVGALEAALHNNRYVSSRFAEFAAYDDELLGCGPDADDDGLTVRQREVLALMADGLNNSQIAQRLSISVNTAKSHAADLLRALGAHDRTEAVAIGLRRELIS